MFRLGVNSVTAIYRFKNNSGPACKTRDLLRTRDGRRRRRRPPRQNINLFFTG